MKALITDIFEAVLGFVLFLIVVVGFAMGGMLGNAREFNFIFAIVGGFVAFMLGVVVTGALYVQLEIRDLLRRQVLGPSSTRQTGSSGTVAMFADAPTRTAPTQTQSRYATSSAAPANVSGSEQIRTICPNCGAVNWGQGEACWECHKPLNA